MRLPSIFLSAASIKPSYCRTITLQIFSFYWTSYQFCMLFLVGYKVNPFPLIFIRMMMYQKYLENNVLLLLLHALGTLLFQS